MKSTSLITRIIDTSGIVVLKLTDNVNIDPGQEKTFTVKYHRDTFHPAPFVQIPIEFPNGQKQRFYNPITQN